RPCSERRSARILRRPGAREGHAARERDARPGQSPRRLLDGRGYRRAGCDRDSMGSHPFGADRIADRVLRDPEDHHDAKIVATAACGIAVETNAIAETRRYGGRRGEEIKLCFFSASSSVPP